jgi:hypothetical protein
VKLSVVDAIKGLDQHQTNRFLASLLGAEASLQGLAPAAVAYSLDERVRDGGVDAILDLSGGQSPTPFPQGRSAWQFKSGDDVPDADKEIRGKGLKGPNPKGYLRDEIRRGAGYVLAWTQGPTAEKQLEIRQQFEKAVLELRPDAKVHCLFNGQLSELALRHVAVAAGLEPLPFARMFRWEDWKSFLQGSEIPFLEDEARRALARDLRQWIFDKDGAIPSIHVFGNAGVGKTRLALELFREEGLRERVLYAPTPAGVPDDFYPWIVQRTDANLYLVIDNCPFEQRELLSGFAAATRNRMKVLTLGDIASYRERTPSARTRQLAPLEADQMAGILTTVLGLTGEQSNFVARHTRGYPRLAWELADEIKRTPQRDVTQLTRGAVINETLGRMLPRQEDRELLGVLAMFRLLGFDSEVAKEATDVCTVFGIDERAFREVVARERHLVQEVGYYRHVTPLLFAIWIGTERLRQYGGSLEGRIQALPEPLFNRFFEQFEVFGPDPDAVKLIDDLMSAFSVNDLAGGTRLVRAAAAVNRSAVIKMLYRVVGLEP